MKRKFFSFSLMASIGLLAFGVTSLTGCGTPSSFTVANVSLDKAKLELSIGEGYQLKVSVSKGYGSDVRWFTSDQCVAYVNDGYVIAVGEGETTVTASIGGGYADCLVVVNGNGGSETTTGNSMTISPTSKTLDLGGSFKISATGKAADNSAVTFTFDSDTKTVATVDAEGNVTGVGVGKATISVVGSNGLSKTCLVTVVDPSQGGGSSEEGDYDIAVKTNLGYSGSLTIGSPLIQREFMTSLLSDFNRLTNSSISFTVTTFEEDNGTSGFANASSMPAVFPYASDQTLTLYQFGALSSISRDDGTWIKNEMGASAYSAARLSSVVGYPFSSDNGVVMFYNGSECSAEDIDTVDKLFDLATQKDMEINYPIGNGFYAAGALMTYTEGKSLYTLTPTTTSYTVKATFNSANGVKGAKLVRRLANEEQKRNATSAPVGDVLATIVDASKVQDFKAAAVAAGATYAVSPLPWVDDAHTARLGSFLGYKFYGVNNTLSADQKNMAASVAKFLCSQYAQVKRFDKYNVRPTLNTLVDYAKGEPHIDALSQQQADNATIPLTAISSELWSASATAVDSLKVLSTTASDTEYKTILDTLDKACQANN